MIKEKFMGESQLDKLETERLQKKPRVLIVEDDSGVDELLRDALEDYASMEAESYESAQKAVAMLEQRKPEDPRIDLLITDLGLTDGIDAGKHVAEAFRNRYPTSSIIFLTGNSDKIKVLYTKEQIKELNFEVLEKPLKLANLRDRVNAVKELINKPPQNQ